MPRKVLVVDDEPSFCELLLESLIGRGYDVVIAYSGEEALETYGEERPDVVLLDVRMPGKDGFETLRELKALDPKVKVIMVSAVTEEGAFKRAREEGAFYITKPVNLNYVDIALKLKLGLLSGDNN